MYVPGKHVYLAAPFFNDAQRELCDFIESLGIQAGYDEVPIYSPRKDGGVLKPDSTDEERKQVFESNTNAIYVAEWMLAVVDDKDAGVLWEMGYAWAQKIPTLAYTDVPGRGLNVMLAGACELGFVSEREKLWRIFTKQELFPRNTWRGSIQ